MKKLYPEEEIPPPDLQPRSEVRVYTDKNLLEKPMQPREYTEDQTELQEILAGLPYVAEKE